jgi:hypothetical protein
LRDILATHLEGGFLVFQAAFRHMRAVGYNRILFIDSNAAIFGMPWATAFAAKGGLRSYEGPGTRGRRTAFFVTLYFQVLLQVWRLD